MTWRRKWDWKLRARYWTKTVELPEGWRLKMDVTMYHGTWDSEFYVALSTRQGRKRLRSRDWGQAVGPGGTAVASASLQLLSEVEALVKRHGKASNGYVVVGAESLRLYLLYRKLLGKRGYVDSTEYPDEYAPQMEKLIYREDTA